MITDRVGNIEYVNPAFSKLTGYSVEETIGQNPRILKSGLNSIENIEYMWKSLINKQRIIGEYVNKTKDGRFIHIEGSADPVLNDKNDIVGFMGIHRDITERKRNEEELMKLSRAVEQSPVSIVITNADGNIEYANPKACDLTGYSLAELIGNNPRVLSSGKNTKEDYKLLWDTIKSGNEWRGEFLNKKNKPLNYKPYEKTLHFFICIIYIELCECAVDRKNF